MDAVLLARIQFALTISFHYLYPPLSIGLALALVVMEGMYLRTRNPLFLKMTKFWAEIFGLTFAIGVATGIVMEFQFGTNWAGYSRYVGDVFGSPLAAEGIFAFFLESSFLAILLFGWNRVGPRMHFFSTLMVALGSALSAVWIVAANSWMQTPAGFHIVGEGANARAEITDFWQMLFNPSFLDRIHHVLMGAWQTGAWFILSVSAYYLLRRKFEDFAKACMKIALVLAFVSAMGQLVSGHASGITVAKYQPVKLAAFEGHFEESAPGKLYLFGWLDEKGEEVRFGLGFPGMLSLLVHFNPQAPLPGLNAFPKRDWPPLNIVFQSYHVMIAVGMGLIGLSVLGIFLWWRGLLFQSRWFLMLLIPAFLGPQIANQTGWIAAEVGRQPWIVYGLLRTSAGVSRVVSANEILISLVMFTTVYGLIFLLFMSFLFRKIYLGPSDGKVSE
ncbi:MAG TPA: cytochrome ubiquinol oxidase subunit I [Candidatus Omnitrophota bacterium]|mgnify:CR=1 FL=1|nr:cytochrome ubiquinol oxidase subunit I [Candidatus Omnitrophota bacterium]